MEELRAQEVFTPNDFPVHTYVKRVGDDVEAALQYATRVPKAVISISGPSKSGKTVLVERVVGADNLILVSGAEIRSPEDVWDKVLDWMGAPSQVSEESSETSETSAGGEVGAGGKIPLFAEANAKADFRRSSGKSASKVASRSRGGLQQVHDEIADSDYVVFLDDFHYMDRDLQAEVARQVKAGAERGIRFCIASVPHRSDDVVRGNPELRGRTTNINTSFWSREELRLIAERGFRALNVEISAEVMQLLANEACGSPQLMQGLCLNLCFKESLFFRRTNRSAVSVEAKDLGQVLEMSSSQTDYSSLIRTMHQGPRVRGMERKVHSFTDGSKGDVYRAVLLAIAKNPPTLELTYQALITRIATVCQSESPAGSSVLSACRKMAQVARTMYPDQRILEFDEDAGAGVLSIVDPYLLFYIRSSKKLASLGRPGDEVG